MKPEEKLHQKRSRPIDMNFGMGSSDSESETEAKVEIKEGTEKKIAGGAPQSLPIEAMPTFVSPHKPELGKKARIIDMNFGLDSSSSDSD